MFYAIQTIGLLALGLFALSFQIKDRKQILYYQASSFVVFAFHYLLLGGYTGMALSLLNAIRALVFSHPKARNQWIFWIFVSLTILFGIVTWEGWHSLLVVAGVLFSTIAHWQKDSQKLRLFYPPSNISWIVYDIFVKSYSGFLSESIALASIIIGLFRYKNNSDTSKS